MKSTAKKLVSLVFAAALGAAPITQCNAIRPFYDPPQVTDRTASSITFEFRVGEGPWIEPGATWEFEAYIVDPCPSQAHLEVRTDAHRTERITKPSNTSEGGDIEIGMAGKSDAANGLHATVLYTFSGPLQSDDGKWATLNVQFWSGTAERARCFAYKLTCIGGNIRLTEVTRQPTRRAWKCNR
jgi:uncharacterized Fe-S cluster protein YjdI